MKSIQFLFLGLITLVFQINPALAQFSSDSHQCRSMEMPLFSPFWDKLMNPTKVKDNVKIRKRCTVNPGYDFSTSAYDGYVLDVILGTLTYAEFRKIKEAFGNYSRVNFDPSRNYNLVDFLPAPMQAMVNKTFKVDLYPELDPYLENIESDELNWTLRSGISSSSNCWNTAMENLKLMAEDGATGVYNLYWPGRWEISEILYDEEYSSEVKKEDIQFGDVVLIAIKTDWLKDDGQLDYSTYQLQHASIVLNDQLTYEKIDSDSLYPYRIAVLDDTGDKIKEMLGDALMNDDYRKESLEISYRRFDFKKFAQSDKSRLAKFDIEEGQYEFEDDEAKKVYADAINSLPRALTDIQLTVGCESGMGGGCSQQITTVKKVKIVIDQDSGLGHMKPYLMPNSPLEKYNGGREVLNRFLDVQYL